MTQQKQGPRVPKAEEKEKATPTPTAAAAAPPTGKAPPPTSSAPPSIADAASTWLPWRVAFTKSLGRHAVAARDIKRGELLLVEAPVASVVRGAFAGALECCPHCASGHHGCGGGSSKPRACSKACERRAKELGERAAPALAAVDDASKKHGVSGGSSGFEGLCSEDLRDLWRMVSMLVAAAALESEGEGGEEEGSGEKEEGEEEASGCGHDHGPNPEADPKADNAESGTEEVKTQWPLRCSVLRDLPHLLDGWDRYRPSWRKQASSMAKEVHSALSLAERERRKEKATGDDDGAPPPPPFHLPRDGSFSKPLDLARLSCLVATNAHGTGAGNPASVDYGFGLFPALAAAFNHSCEPTANFVAAGGFMRSRALRDIRRGEQLTVSYVNLFEPRRTRRHQLQEAKHFSCRCPRCSVPILEARDRFLDGVACGRRGCRGGTLIPVAREEGEGGGGGGKKKNKGGGGGEKEAKAADDGKEGAKAGGGEERRNDEEPPWTCDTCGAVVPARSPPPPAGGKAPPPGPADVADAAAVSYSRAVAASRPSSQDGASRRAASAAAAPLFEAVVNLSPAKLHPHHVLVFDSLMPLCNGLRARGDAAGAARAVGLLIQAMDSLVGEHVPTAELGNLLQLHAELLEQRCEGGSNGALASRLARSAREAAARALDVRRTTLGPRNPMTREAEELVARLKTL